MATLLDTSALTVLIRRSPPAPLRAVRRAARDEIEAGRALLSGVTAVELLVGARGAEGVRRIRELLEVLPVVAADRTVATEAGRMGFHARSRGATIPVPDLLIAATAVWLDVPLLTCDSDFGRGGRVCENGDDSPWGRLRLHPASVV